jgi:O-antigen/teichoic acid export membrane protein
MLVSDKLIPILFSSSYAGSAGVFRIYLCFVPLRVATFGLLLRAAGLTRYDLLGSIASLLVSACLGTLLVMVLGVTGPAWATVAALFVLVSYLLLVTRHRLGFRLAELIPWGALVKRAGLGAASFLVPFLLDVFLFAPSATAPMLAMAIETGLFFAAYLLLLLRFSRDDLTFLWRFVRPRTRAEEPPGSRERR